MNQTVQLKRTMTRILLAFMLILTGYAGVFAQEEDASSVGNCSVYSVKDLYPTSSQTNTNVFAWTVKLNGDKQANGLSHFSLISANTLKCLPTASLIKKAWYSTAEKPGPVGVGSEWQETTVVIEDGSINDCLPNGNADKPYVIKFSQTAEFIHYALEFKFKYPVSSGLAIPKYGNSCCTTPIQFPNLCDPEPICVDPTFTFNKTDLTCFGSANGSISVTGVTGGVSPYSYSINGGTTYSGSSIFNNLSAGTYNVRVKESEGDFVALEILGTVLRQGCHQFWWNGVPGSTGWSNLLPTGTEERSQNDAMNEFHDVLQS